MPSVRPIAVVLWMAATVAQLQGEEVYVAAAASMTRPVREIVAAFERESPHTVRLSFGSSGNVYGQIANGAPFDIFLSADTSYVSRLEADDLIEPGTLEIYAVGRLVVWTRADSALMPEEHGIEVLRDPRARRIAIANPRLAPYGEAAVAAMEYFELYQDVASKLVLGENIAQAAQFVGSGAADVAVLAMSLARDPAMGGRYWEVPQDAHAPIEHGMAVLRQTRRSGRGEAARSFRDFVRGPAGRAVLERYGFSVP